MPLFSRSTRTVRFKLPIALSRGLRIENGRADIMTQDYTRNGTTSLFAALIARMAKSPVARQVKRHQECTSLPRYVVLAPAPSRSGRTPASGALPPRLVQPIPPARAKDFSLIRQCGRCALHCYITVSSYVTVSRLYIAHPLDQKD